MRKGICFSLISLVCSFLSVHAATQSDNTKPFAGKWEYWEDNCQIQLEIDLYSTPTDGSYGAYNVSEGGSGLTYSVVEIYRIDGTGASVAVEGGMGKQKAEFKYNPATREVTFLPPGSDPVVFKQKDKCNYVFISGGDKINVRSTPVSGAPLMKADRGQSFRVLGKEKGWFKVELSAKDKRVGYISPEYAFYLKDNTIPQEAFTKKYGRDLTSFTLEKKGNQVFMEKITMYPPQGESIPTPTVEYYAGEIEGNAVVFTRFSGMPTQDISQMGSIKPYVIYYWKEAQTFIMEGENYAADM